MKRILVKILCVCISILALVAVSTLAEEYSGPTFDLTYEVSNGEVTITDCYYQSTIVETPRSIVGYPVTRIGVSAFGLDTFEYFTGTNLKDIYYAGTEEEWGRIVGKNKYDLVNVTMHYNYKMPKINEDNSEVSDNDGDIDKVIFTIGEKNYFFSCYQQTEPKLFLSTIKIFEKSIDLDCCFFYKIFWKNT